MSWALWLLVPVAVPLLAAVAIWWRGRPTGPPDGDAAMQAHRDYLAALVVPARGTDRVEHP